MCVCVHSVCTLHLCWATFAHEHMCGDQELYLSPDMRIKMKIICAETLEYIF